MTTLKACQERYDALAEEDPDEVESREAWREAEVERRIDDYEWDK